MKKINSKRDRALAKLWNLVCNAIADDMKGKLTEEQFHLRVEKFEKCLDDYAENPQPKGKSK